MFGRPIADTVAIEKEFGGGGYVPFIVDKCCEYVKDKGMNYDVAVLCMNTYLDKKPNASRAVNSTN